MLVGIGNTLFDFAIYTILALFVFSESLAIAGVVSGTLALIVAFTSHALVTWRNRQVGRTTALKFLVFTGFGMWVIRPVLLVLFAKMDWLYVFAYSSSSSLGMPFSLTFITNTGAFGFMIIVVLMYNYQTYNRYVFNDRK